MHEHIDDTVDGAFPAQRRSEEAVRAHKGSPPPRSREGTTDHSAAGNRVEMALRATHALAFPRSARHHRLADPNQRDDADEREAVRAEEALLRSALHVLHDLALPTVISAYVPSEASMWRSLAEPDHQVSPALELGDVIKVRRSQWTAVSPSLHPDLWQAFAAWRAGVPHTEALTLIPVRTDEEVRAVFALGFDRRQDVASEWLPTAGAVANACAAGIEMQRLRRSITAETSARDAYISLAAHELRSPITSIKGYAQLLIRQARRFELPEAMMRSVDSIEQQSARMAEMVSELLDASRIRRGSLELLVAPTDLVSVARRAVERRAPFYPQHDFILESEESSLVGVWDAGRIEQVLRDLLDNAARHMSAGGQVITTVSRQAGSALVSVRDEGIGIAEEDRDRIFDYLYRAPRSEQRNLAGLGLGLYVSRHIVDRHGGQLTLAATRIDAPTGSEFRFTLPLIEKGDGVTQASYSR